MVLAAAGLEALVVPSAAAPTGTNVLVFPANLSAGGTSGGFRVDQEVHWP